MFFKTTTDHQSFFTVKLYNKVAAFREKKKQKKKSIKNIWLTKQVVIVSKVTFPLSPDKHR